MRSYRMPKPPGDPDPFRSPGQRLAGPGRCPRRPCHLISSPVHMLSITSDDREIFRLAIPALGALAAEPLVALVDTAFVGRLGGAPLAALGVVTGLLGLVFFVFIALAYASTPLIARAMGAGDRDRAAVLAGQSMLIAVVLVVIGLVVFETAAPQLVRLMGSAPEVEHLAVGYLRLRGLGLPALLAITVGHAVYRGLGDTRTPMFISLGLSLINVVLDPVLIFGFGWGLAGAGIATVIAQSAGAAVPRSPGQSMVAGRVGETMCPRFAIRMLILFSLLSLTAPPPASAQTNQLSGRVRSDDGRPVEGALAELHPVSDSTLTVYTLASELGFYSFRDLEPGTYVLTVTRIGFREHRSIARSWSEVS